MNKKDFAIIEHAKRLLIEKGWTQGAYAQDIDGKDGFDDEGLAFFEKATRFCLVGALMCAGNCYSSSSTLDNIINRIQQDTDRDIFDWNDASDRKKEDVIALLDKLLKEGVV